MKKLNNILTSIKSRGFKKMKPSYFVAGGIIIVIIISLIIVYFSAKRENLEDYLVNLGYKKDEWGCLVNDTHNEERIHEVANFCLYECKYYSDYFDVDRFTLDVETGDISYEYRTRVLYEKKDGKESCNPTSDDVEARGFDIKEDCDEAKRLTEGRLEVYKNIVKKYPVICTNK